MVCCADDSITFCQLSSPPQPLGYGVLLMRQGLFSFAVAVLEEAVSIDRRFSSPWNNLGVAYKHMGLHKEAARAFSKACRLERTPSQHRLLQLNLAASFVQFFQCSLSLCVLSLAHT